MTFYRNVIFVHLLCQFKHKYPQKNKHDILQWSEALVS